MAIAPIAFLPAALRADNSWINPAGGKWSVGSNWSLGTPPGGETALFNLGSTSGYTVDMTGIFYQPSIGNDNVTFIDGSMNSIPPYQLGAAGQTSSMTLVSNSFLGSYMGPITIGTSDGTGVGHLTLNKSRINVGHGNVNVLAGTFSLQNRSAGDGGGLAGIQIGGGTSAASVTLDNSVLAYNNTTSILANGSLFLSNHAQSLGQGFWGTLNMAGSSSFSPATLVIDNSTFSSGGFGASYIKNGIVTATNGANVSLDGQPGVFITSGANISAGGPGTTLYLGGGDGSYGPGTIVGTDTPTDTPATVRLESGAVGSSDNLKIAASGNLKVLTGARLNVKNLDLSTAGSYDITGGTIDLTGGTLTMANLIIPNTSTLMGIGALTGNLTSSGTVSPGHTPGSSPGVLKVNGNYLQGAAASLVMGLGGVSDINPIPDQLAVVGSASLAGTLQVVPLANWQPQVGDQYHILNFGSETGTFSTVNLPALIGGQTWDASGLYSTGTIQIVAEASSVWIASGGGGWNSAGNWQNNSVPDAVAASATLGIATSGPFNLSLNGNRTLGDLVFSGTNAYTISAGAPAASKLIFDQGGNSAVINVQNGSHTITVPVQLNSSVSITIANSSSTLAMNGPVSGAGGLALSAGGTLVLAASNSYAGMTSIASGANLLATAPGALPGGGAITNDGQLSVNADNKVGQFNFDYAPTSQAALAIGPGVNLQIAPASGAGAQRVLSIAPGGKLDITNNGLSLVYSISGSGASPNAAIRSYISNGYHSAGALWTGTLGIVSSNAAADPAHHSVAFADGADGVVTNLPAGISSYAANGTLAAGVELVTYAYAGDANLDGKVDFSDFIILSNHFGASDINWDHGNFNFDPTVDFSDFIVLSNNFGAGTSAGSGATPQQLAQYNAMAAKFGISQNQIAAWDAAIANLPEPTPAAILAIGCMAILPRRRSGKARSAARK